ncbi:MAG: YbaB/EbfC family nucleoid-associated protein [Mycoplasmoidaceae bacterium]|nr:YbaB/EbfC family nucleoid-associated protein [Mycoplasmoidaceae bacterium]
MNMNQIMAQAQKMQKQLQEKLEQLYKQEFTYDYQNGSVMVTVFGNGVVKNIEINKTLIDPEDPITLQEMVTEAINSAVEQVKAKADEIQQSLMPAGMGGLF